MSMMTVTLLAVLAIFLPDNGSALLQSLGLSRRTVLVVLTLLLLSGLIPSLSLYGVTLSIQMFVLPLILGLTYAGMKGLWRKRKLWLMTLAVTAVLTLADAIWPIDIRLQYTNLSVVYGLLGAVVTLVIARKATERLAVLLLALPLADIAMNLVRLFRHIQNQVFLGELHMGDMLVFSVLVTMLWTGAVVFLKDRVIKTARRRT